MTIFFSEVDCFEEHNSVSETYDLATGDTKAKVVLRCAWDARHALVEDLLLNKREWPYGNLAEVAFAQSCSVGSDQAGFTQLGQGMYYAHALVTVNYGTLGRDPVSEELEPTVEFIRQDWKRFRWGSGDGDPITEEQAPGKLTRGLNIVRKFFLLDPPLPDVIYDGIGGVNAEEYVSELLDGRKFPSETLLYQPPSLNRIFKPDGSKAFNLTLKFSYKPHGWNVYWRQDSMAYEALFDSETEDEFKSYPLTDFSEIFK